MKQRFILILVCVAGMAVVLVGQAVPQKPAGDWPQWRGPDRTGLSRETGLLKAWPKDGPRLIWSVNTLGPGVGSVSVVGEHIFVQGSDPLKSKMLSLARADGRTEWVTDLGTVYRAGDAGAGPRATPTVDGNRIYAMTEGGALACLRARNGGIIWQRNVLTEFEAASPTYLVAESPLVDGARLYVTPGGPAAGIVALDKMTGKTIWKTGALGKGGAGYGSLFAADLHGVRTILAITADGGVGVRASDGKVMWNDPRPAAGDGNMATPVVLDNKVLYGFASGLALLDVTLDHRSLAATPIYFSNALGVQWGGVLHINGYLYGFNGGGLWCVDAATGKSVWRSRSVGVGALTYADGHLYLLSRDFVVGLVEATRAAYKETGRFTIAETPTPVFAHPVVAGGRLYIRNQGMLSAYDIKAK